MIQEFKGTPRVFASHKGCSFKNFHRPETNITQIPNGRADNIQSCHEIKYKPMRMYLQLLVFITIGVSLLWFGYTLLIKQWSGIRFQWNSRQKRRGKGTAAPGDPQVCPICSMPLDKGDLVRTLAFPSITGGKDRLMHIRGCYYCLEDHFERFCPVCGATLGDDEILVARLFERSNRRPHVHVLGCSHCRKKGTM